MTDESPPAPARDTSNLIRLLLIPMGAACWLLLGNSMIGRYSDLTILVMGLVVLAIPGVAKLIDRATARFGESLARRPGIAFVCISILGAAALLVTGWQQGRSFHLCWHDEFVYLIQTRALAEGKLWLPTHPLGDFLHSFYVFTSPVYTGMYGVGGPLVYVPFVWMHAPFWVGPLVCAGVSLGLVYLIAAKLMGPRTGVIASVILLGNPAFRFMSLALIGQPPGMMLALLAVLCLLRWHDTRRALWMAMTGLFLAWLFVTRPGDGLCVGLPILIDVLWQCRRDIKSIARFGLIGFLGAAPLLALQATINHRVTGSATTFPHSAYHDRYLPAARFGFHEYDPALAPATDLPQFHALYDEYYRPTLQNAGLAQRLHEWTDSRLLNTIYATTPRALLLLVLPLGLWTMIRTHGWVMAAVIPMFVLIYTAWPPFAYGYAVIIAPVCAILFAAGCALRGATRDSGMTARWSTSYLNCAGMVFAIVCIAGVMPQLNHTVADETFLPTELVEIDRALEKIDKTPAVVMFRFGPGVAPIIEPVYNETTAWPDDATILRVHDRGEKNGELYRYLANTGKDRAVYRYDRATKLLEYLGGVKELAKQSERP